MEKIKSIFDSDVIKGRNIFNKINYHNFENLIVRAIKMGAFIELNSLIHNAIEHYLQFKIIDEIYCSFGINKFNSEKENLNIYNENKKIIDKKVNILLNKGKTNFLKYLVDYVEIAFIMNIISDELYDKILKFNSTRNKVIHQLLKKSDKYSFLELIENAKLGRYIQLKLSPLNHTDKDIKNILKFFENDTKVALDNMPLPD